MRRGADGAVASAASPRAQSRAYRIGVPASGSTSISYGSPSAARSRISEVYIVAEPAAGDARRPDDRGHPRGAEVEAPAALVVQAELLDHDLRLAVPGQRLGRGDPLDHRLLDVRPVDRDRAGEHEGRHAG